MTADGLNGDRGDMRKPRVEPGVTGFHISAILWGGTGLIVPHIVRYLMRVALD